MECMVSPPVKYSHQHGPNRVVHVPICRSAQQLPETVLSQYSGVLLAILPRPRRRARVSRPVRDKPTSSSCLGTFTVCEKTPSEHEQKSSQWTEKESQKKLQSEEKKFKKCPSGYEKKSDDGKEEPLKNGEASEHRIKRINQSSEQREESKANIDQPESDRWECVSIPVGPTAADRLNCWGFSSTLMRAYRQKYTTVYYQTYLLTQPNDQNQVF